MTGAPQRKLFHGTKDDLLEDPRGGLHLPEGRTLEVSALGSKIKVLFGAYGDVTIRLMEPGVLVMMPFAPNQVGITRATEEDLK